MDAYLDDVGFPYGVIGLAGNADEWCADAYEEARRRRRGWARAARRGVVLGPRACGRICDRSFARASDRFGDTGFRCALDAPGAPGAGAAPAERAGSGRGRRRGRALELRGGRLAALRRPALRRRVRARYAAETGREVRVIQTHLITSNDELPELLSSGRWTS
ncbi:MAG: SUMF1/EgtB/PvdO family nonheme iron enzyme [Planctomycetota bacterium]